MLQPNSLWTVYLEKTSSCTQDILIKKYYKEFRIEEHNLNKIVRKDRKYQYNISIWGYWQIVEVINNYL